MLFCASQEQTVKFSSKLFRISFCYFLGLERGVFIYTKKEIIALGGRSNYYYQAISTDQPQCISLDAFLILHDPSSDKMYYKMTSRYCVCAYHETKKLATNQLLYRLFELKRPKLKKNAKRLN